MMIDDDYDDTWAYLNIHADNLTDKRIDVKTETNRTSLHTSNCIQGPRCQSCLYCSSNASSASQ